MGTDLLQALQSQPPVRERVLEVAGMMLGTDKSWGISLQNDLR